MEEIIKEDQMTTPDTAQDNPEENRVLPERNQLDSPVEKRQHPRYSAKLPIDLWQTADEVLGGVVTDMSEAGLGFSSVHEIQISTDLGIRVYLSRGEFHFDCIEGTGRIIWRTAHRERDWKGYRYGIYISKMAVRSRDRLMKYIQMVQDEENSSH